MRRMRSRYMDFWSREMKARSIKWSKVVVLCMAGHARFVTEAGAVFIGVGEVRGDRVTIETPTGKIAIPRDDLMAILPGEARELDRWGYRVGIALDANVGNTEQTAFNPSASIRREDYRTRFEVAYTGTFGTANRVENINRHRVETKLDWFFSRRFYWAILDMPAVNDKFQNLNLRIAPSSGLGLWVFDRSGLEWSVELATGLQYTRFISVPLLQNPEATDAVVRFGTEFKWDIVQNLEFKARHDTLLVPTELGLTSLFTRVALKYEITWLLKLETAVVHNRVFEPVPAANGQVPKPDDLQFIVGFTLDTY